MHPTFKKHKIISIGTEKAFDKIYTGLCNKTNRMRVEFPQFDNEHPQKSYR